MGTSKARTRLLCCFGCGLAGPSRSGSAKHEIGPTSDSSSPVLGKAAGDSSSASVAAESPAGSRPLSPGGGRRPSQAFVEPAPQGPSLTELPTKKNDNASATTSTVVPAPATAALSGGTAAAAPAVTRLPPVPKLPEARHASRTGKGSSSGGSGSDGSGCSGCSANASNSIPWRRVRKPHVRTSLVWPAYDTGDELSPTAGMSCFTSGSSGYSSSSGGTYSASLEPPSPAGAPLQGEALLDGDGDSGGDGGSSIKQEDETDGRVDAAGDERTGGDGPGLRPSVTLEAEVRQRTVPISERERQQQLQVEEVTGGGRRPLPLHPGAVCTGSFPTNLTSSTSSAAAAAAAAATTAAASLSAVAQGAAARKCSTEHPFASRDTLRNTSTGSGSGSGAGERPGGSGLDGDGSSGTSTAAASDRIPGLDPLRPVRDVSSSSGEDSLAQAIVVPTAAADDDDVPYCGNGAAATAALRGSFAGDSSTSLVGPSSVSETPQLRNQPSLRTTHRSVDVQESQQEQQQQLLAPCQSLRLSPAPPEPQACRAAAGSDGGGGGALHACGSLCRAPLASTSPPRLLTPSLKMRPRLLALPPSPSLVCQSPLSSPTPRQQLQQAHLPGALGTPTAASAVVAMPTAAVAASASGGDTMLRLPPPLLQQSPCSTNRSAFPRANTLAPLVVHTSAVYAETAASVPASALNRLASLQAVHRAGQQPHQQQLEEDEALGSQATAALLRRPSQNGACSPATADETANTSSARPAVVASTTGHLEEDPCGVAATREQERAGLEDPLVRGATAERRPLATTTTAVAIAGLSVAPTNGCIKGIEAAIRSGGLIVDSANDEYDSGSFCDDVVDSLVGRLMPPSSYKSWAPAVPHGGVCAKDEPMRHTATSLEPQPQPRTPIMHPKPPPQRIGYAASYGGDIEELATAMVPDPPSDFLGIHTATWLEELLPPSPGYGTQRPAVHTGRTVATRRTVVAAPDSFKSLMREIE